MNKSMIRYLLSKLLLIEAVLLLVPVAVAIYYRESSQVFTALFSTIGILVLLGGSGILQKPKNQQIYAKEGVLIVALCWILWSFFGGLPFVFAGQIPSRLYNYWCNYSERRFCPQPFPPLLAKFYPLDWRDGGACFCTCYYGQCQE